MQILDRAAFEITSAKKLIGGEIKDTLGYYDEIEKKTQESIRKT